MKREALLAIVLYFAAVTCLYAQQPPAPPVQYQVQWQPVYVPGYYVAVPRVVPALDWVLGPRVYFQPLPQQQPVQGQR